MSGYAFKSSVVGMSSDAQSNGDSGGWGTEFADWLKPKLQNLGYKVLRTEPDTMGWTLRLQDEPFKLSVTFMVCEAGTASNFKDLGMGKDEGLWQCYSSVSKPFFAGLFKKIDTQPAEAKLEQALKTILSSEPGIELVAEPEFEDSEFKDSGFSSNSRDDSSQPVETELAQDLETNLTLEPGTEPVAEPEAQDSDSGGNNRDDS